MNWIPTLSHHWRQAGILPTCRARWSAISSPAHAVSVPTTARQQVAAPREAPLRLLRGEAPGPPHGCAPRPSAGGCWTGVLIHSRAFKDVLLHCGVFEGGVIITFRSRRTILYEISAITRVFGIVESILIILVVDDPVRVIVSTASASRQRRRWNAGLPWPGARASADVCAIQAR